jgi:hypothetical protein
MQSCSHFYSFSHIREVGRLEPGLSSMLLSFLPSWAVEGLEQVGLDSWNPRFRCDFTSFLVEVIGVDNVQGWVLDVRMMITSASPLSLNNPLYTKVSLKAQLLTPFDYLPRWEGWGLRRCMLEGLLFDTIPLHLWLGPVAGQALS